MNLKISLALFSIVLLTIPNQISVAAQKRKLKYCHLDQLFECMMEPLWYFTAQNNGTGIPAENSDFENFCFNIHDVLPYCFKNYANRCLTPVIKDLLMDTLLRNYRQSMEVFCNEKNNIRQRFLRHSKCLISHVKLSPIYRRECVRPLQASAEWWALKTKKNNYSIFDQMKSVCCIYQPWENCIVRQLQENCGEEAGIIIKDLIYHGSGFLIPQLCNRDRYNPDSAKCECNYDEYAPPANFVPRGLNSNSIISYIFSLSCPNVGWGIESTRDF